LIIVDYVEKERVNINTGGGILLWLFMTTLTLKRSFSRDALPFDGSCH
jgi:hypothetical protein